jgi:hypothetical protein
MNIVAAIGRIEESSLNGRVLKFTLAIQQDKPCKIPCILFDPNDEVKEFIRQLQVANKLVWLQGKVASYEFEYNDKIIRKLEIATYHKNIKEI